MSSQGFSSRDFELTKGRLGEGGVKEILLLALKSKQPAILFGELHSREEWRTWSPQSVRKQEPLSCDGKKPSVGDSLIRLAEDHEGDEVPAHPTIQLGRSRAHYGCAQFF